MSKREPTNPFAFHGMEIELIGSQLQGNCPLCQKDGHFYANPKTFLWDCKRCGLSGNVATFLTLLVEASYDATTSSDFDDFSLQRNIPVVALKKHRLCRSILTGEWLLPTFRKTRKDGQQIVAACNVHRYVDTPDGYKLFGTPTCKAIPFNTQNIRRSTGILIAEGHWDGIVLDHIIDANKLTKEWSVIAVPGANVWKDDFDSIVTGRPIAFLYDNDDPGQKGCLRAINHLAEQVKQPASVKRLAWPEDTTLKYDIRDLFTEHDQSPEKTWAALSGLLTDESLPELDEDEKVAAQRVTPLACESFDDLLNRFRETDLDVSQIWQDSLLVVLATIFAIDHPGGDMLWLYLRGPAGTGKTTLVLPATGIPTTKFVSKFTGLHSGQKNKGGADNSLVSEMRNKVLFVKDWTTILKLPGKDVIYGELRDIFDGSSSSYYRNNVRNDYQNLNTGIVACTTNEIHKEKLSSLGERFLQCNMWEDSPGARQRQILASMKSTATQLSADDAKESTVNIRRQYTLGFMQTIQAHYSGNPLPEVSEHYQLKIAAAADIISRCRSTVEREYRTEQIIYRPEAEVGTRIASQLFKLATCVAAILQKDEVDDEVYRVVCKIANDTAPEYELNILRCLANATEPTERNQRPSGWMDKSAIATATRLHPSSCQRKLNDLLELGIIRRGSVSNNSGRRGRNTHVFALTQEIAELWQKAEF